MCAPASVLSLPLSMFAHFLPSQQQKKTRKPHALNETHSGCKIIFVKHTFLCRQQYIRCAAVESQRVRRRQTHIQPTVEISIHKTSKWISEWVSKWERERERAFFSLCISTAAWERNVLFFSFNKNEFPHWNSRVWNTWMLLCKWSMSRSQQH